MDPLEYDSGDEDEMGDVLEVDDHAYRCTDSEDWYVVIMNNRVLAKIKAKGTERSKKGVSSAR